MMGFYVHISVIFAYDHDQVVNDLADKCLRERVADWRVYPPETTSFS